MPCGARDGNHPLVQPGEVTEEPQWVILDQCCLEVAEPLAEPNDCNNIKVNIGHKKLNDIDVIKRKL
mgnify:CR=1 FL=1